MNDVKKLILIGGGNRGKRYTDISLTMPEKFKVVAVAEPIEERRRVLARIHGLPESACYESWEGILEKEKFADAVIIATMDRDHFAPSMAAIERGYDLLLEKPISPLPEECRALTAAAQAKGVSVLICHVLRYTPFCRTLRRLIDGGKIGQLINIELTEPVGNVHQSHSFVRGNWGNVGRSSPMLLQKSCHDMDILQWLIGKECRRVSSFGSLSHFCRANKPEGAPEFCIEGCPHGESCPYNAVKLYMDDKENAWFRTASTHMHEPTDADVERAVRESNYGRCVYSCDNDVVDHQVVNLEFEGGITCGFTMCAFGNGARSIRVMGTKGEIRGEFKDATVDLYEFETKTHTEIRVADAAFDDSIVGGHGGGDNGIMHAFYELLCGREDVSLCDIDVSCKNHMIAFAVERARAEGRVVSLDEFYK